MCRSVTTRIHSRRDTRRLMNETAGLLGMLSELRRTNSTFAEKFFESLPKLPVATRFRREIYFLKMVLRGALRSTRWDSEIHFESQSMKKRAGFTGVMLGPTQAATIQNAEAAVMMNSTKRANRVTSAGR